MGHFFISTVCDKKNEQEKTLQKFLVQYSHLFFQTNFIFYYKIHLGENLEETNNSQLKMEKTRGWMKFSTCSPEVHVALLESK